MTPPTWKQVTAAECLKWQIDNPMKEARFEGVAFSGSLRFNPESGAFEFLEAGRWKVIAYPGALCYTYFIPEVTE